MEAFVRNHDSFSHAVYSDRDLEPLDDRRRSSGDDSSARRWSSSSIRGVGNLDTEMLAMLPLCGDRFRGGNLEEQMEMVLKS